MAISSAVDIDRISRIVGYQLTTGNFQNVTPNLPQRIAIISEANTANQGTLDFSPREINSAKQAGDVYGYGSPIYQIMRILRPYTSNGVGGIPTIVYPLQEAGFACVKTVTVTGTAAGSGTHTIVINGRRGIDGASYNFDITDGDSASNIATKIRTAVNSVIGSPVVASGSGADVVLTTKWVGISSNELTVTVDSNDIDVSVTYAVANTTAGSGVPDINEAIDVFGSNWNTIVVNGLGSATGILDALSTFNGAPSATNPTGRYAGIVMKPFISLFGNRASDPTVITSSRKDDVTNAVCPAPYTAAFTFEAAANMAFLFAKVMNEKPHTDVNALFYPDMPIPSNGIIGAMSDYNNRDTFVKNGSSTVDLVNGKYQVQDFVTCYHPDGETPPQFRYCRNLMLDFNVKFGYRLLEEKFVVDHTIANDDDIVSVDNVIKPKQWKQVIDAYAEELGKRALIADVPFMQNSIQVGLSTVNPDRLETSFSYKRTGIARIASTTVEAGFNFGTL